MDLVDMKKIGVTVTGSDVYFQYRLANSWATVDDGMSRLLYLSYDPKQTIIGR